jgi:hypothetical protein
MSLQIIALLRSSRNLKSLVVYKHFIPTGCEQRGKWKVACDIFNSDLPGAP